MTLKQLYNRAKSSIGSQSKRAVNAAKSGVSAVNDALVPGEGKASDITKEPARMKAVLRGTKPPLKKAGGY